MPEGIKTYATANGTLVNVPESKVDTFLELFPDSEEYIGIKDDKGEEGYLSAKEFGSYRAQNPNIRPLSGDYQSYFNDIYSGSSKPQLPSIVKQQFPALDKVNDLAGPRQVVKPANVADRSTIQQPFPVPTEQEFEEANAKLKAELAAKEAKNSLKGNFLSNQFEKSKNDTYDISEGLKVAGKNALGVLTEIPDFVTKELADRMSGPKPGDFAYGLGYDPNTIENEPIHIAAQKIADDADKRIEEHAMKLKEASAGNEGWAYVGASLPTLFELGVATFSRNPELSKLVIDKMAATAYLKQGVAFDNYIKESGEEPDGTRKQLYQIASALIFKVNFTALANGLSPKYAKDITQGIASKLFVGNKAQQVKNATELIGKAVEGSTLSKKLLNDVVHGAGIGTAFGVSQDIADRVLMGQDKTFGQSVKDIAESAASMAAFSGILSPIGLFAQKAGNMERWEKQKVMAFTTDAKGNTVEILRDGTGITPDGKKVDITPEMHSKAFAVPYSIIEKTNFEIKSGIEPTKKEREVTEFNHRMFSDFISDSRGLITEAKLRDGETIFIKGLAEQRKTSTENDGVYVVDPTERYVVSDTNGNKFEVNKNNVTVGRTISKEDFIKQKMYEWDIANSERPSQPEQQQLTGADPQQPGEQPIQPNPVTELQNKISPVINDNGTHIVTNAHVDGKPYFIKSGVLLDQDGRPDLDSIDPSTPPILVDSEGNITNIPFTDFDPTTWESSPAQTIVENKQAEIVAQQEQEAIQEQAQEQAQEQIQQEQAQQPQTIEIGKKKFSFVEQGEEDIYDLSQSKDPQGDINTLNEYLNSKGYKAFPQAETVVIPPANKYEQPTQKQVITKAIVRPYKPMSEIQLPTQQRMADIMSTPTEGATTTPTPAAAQITPEQIAQQEQQMQQVQEMEHKFADAEAQDITKIKRKGLFLSKEGIMRSSVEAQTPEEAILQFFAAGNKIPKNDFIALTGWGNKNVKRVHGVTELNQYRWLWGIKDAVPVDKIPNVMGSQVLSDYLEQSGGNAIQNLVQSAIMSHSTRESMINELAIMQASKAGQDIDPEALAEEYYAKLEEQALESKAEEDEIYNHILSTIVNELNGEIPANLFNFEENEQIETGGSLTTIGETDSEINAGNRNDEVGSTADSETEPQQSQEVNETGIKQIIPTNIPLPLPEGSARSGEVVSLPESQSELDTQELDSYISEQSHNTKPTEKQKKTGIYDKARISLQGHNITIETLKGTDRSGVDSNGKAWSITMNNHYGELDGTKGYDGDAIDVFVGPNPKQGQIFVIDQLSNNGTFDESKVMLGFDTAEQAKDAYMSNYEAGWQGFGSITPAGDSFKAWLYDGKKQRKPFGEYKETPEPVSSSTGKADNSEEHETTIAKTETIEPKFAGEVVKEMKKPITPIEDYGEKIEGARKDQIKKYFDKINLDGKTLSTIFPKPDIKGLLESGLSVKDVSGIKVAHEFATQDKKKGERVIKFYAAYAKNILAESINLKFANSGYVFSDYGKSQIELRTKAYQDVHDKLGAEYLSLDLTKVDIREADKSGRTTYFDKGEPVTDVKYIVRYYVSKTSYFQNVEDAVNEFTEQVKANTKTDQVTYKHKLNVYSARNQKGVFYIGFPSKGDVIKLKEGITSTKEAFDMLKNPEIHADLQTMLERILAENRQSSKPAVRLKYNNETARERVGKDWREGVNVGAKELAETFGFRGIEFGNWVNQKERQVFVNNTFDSLMDLAQLLNISPKAISLGGNIGITFGSRGSGKAAAHYEPGRKIINLTKTQGLGSLAHEWWHAIDNYFAGFETSLQGTKHASAANYLPETREEIKKSFDEVNKAVDNYTFKQRAKNLDNARNANYFSLPHEMSARAFENFILNRLAQNGQVNDFIVNYTSNEDWKGEASKYPYPIGDESVKIAESFNNLFDVIEEVKEGDNVILKHRRRKEEEIISPNLVALHNIQAGNIRNIEKIGGMITPSIAILEKETPYTDFGDITLIANKKLINPENYDVKIFKGDVYSPSVPRPEWEVNKGPYISWVNKIISKTYDSYMEIASTVQNVVDDFGSFGKALSRYEHESLKESEYNEMKKVYLIEKGIPINMPMKGYPVKIGFNFYINELTPDEKVQARELLNKYNKETKASSSDITDETKKAIYKLAGDIAYRELLSHYQSIEGLPEGFANSEAEEQRKKVMDNVNIHYFTDSLGDNLNNRQQLDTNKIDDAIQKSFKKNVKKAEYDEWLDNLIYSFQGRKYFERGNEKVPYTLENLIDATSGKTRGQEKGITFGMNRAKSYAIKQMKTVQDLHKHKKDLISKEEMSRIEKELQAEYFSVADKIKYGYNDQWGKLDDFGRSLADYYKGNSPSNALRKNGFKPDSYDIDNFKEYADKLANSPVDYFEAKIQRGVELSEFKYAIVPKTTDKDVIEILKSKGVKVKKYDTEQERTSIINELAEKDSQILFHKKPRFAGDLLQEMNAKRAIPSAVNTQTLQEPTLIPDGKAYETSQGNTIRYNTSEPTGQYGIKGQDNTSMDSDTGEFCAVERLLNEQKHIDLTGTTTIKSPDDVAFLFRHLEEAASENAFAVFIKPDKSYKVLYLSTGSTTGTVVDSKLIALAAKEFKAKSVTFVHNHPSGNLMTSEADVNLHKRVVNALKGICNVNPGIIINLDSGKYAEFGFDDYETKPVDYNKEASKVKVYQFDKQKLYTPSIERPHVTGSTDVAKVLSKIKRGTDKKYIILVLDRRNNVTRALLDNDISPKHLLPIIAKHGEAVIISGNIELEKSKLIEIKSHLQAADISFLDYIQVEPDADIIKAYKSYADEGYLFEPETKYETGTVYESKPTFAGEAIEQILKSRQSEIGFYSPTEKALNAIQQSKPTHEQVKAHAEKTLAQLNNNTKMVIVDKATELKTLYINEGASKQLLAQIDGVISNPYYDGFFDPTTRKIVIITSRVDSLEQTESIINHESVHATNKNFLGERRRDILNFFHEQYGEQNALEYLSEDYSDLQPFDMADEVIAYTVQDMIDNNTIPTENPLTYREIVDIVEGNTIIDNFTERLISTIYHETQTHKGTNGGIPVVPESDRSPMDGVRPDQEGQSGEKGLADNGNLQREKPQFAGELLGEGSLGLLKSISLGKTKDMSEPTFQEIFQQRYFAIQDLKDKGVKRLHVNGDATVTVYHGTSVENWSKIQKEGFNGQTFFSVNKSGTQYGDSPIDVAKRKFGENGIVVEVKVDPRHVSSAAAGSELYAKNELIYKDGHFEEKQIPSTITINGTPRPTTNSKGQPIADSEEKIRNFYNWFSDSKVVDEQGRPLVVYHGTGKNFDAFNSTKFVTAGYFAKDPKLASHVAELQASNNNVIPVYLDIKNLFDLSEIKAGYEDITPQELISKFPINIDGYFKEKLLNYSPNPLFTFVGDVDFIEYVKLKGFDGIAFHELTPEQTEIKELDGNNWNTFNLDDGLTYVALSPTQIKSATGNSGSFDPNDPNILKHSKGNGRHMKRIIGEKDYGDRFAEWIAEDVHSVDLWQKEMLKDGIKGTKLFDVYQETRLRKGKIKGLVDKFDKGPFKTLEENLAKLIDTNKTPLAEIQKYIKAKSALERNDNEGIRAISEDPADDWNRDNVTNIIQEFEAKTSPTEITELWDNIKDATDFGLDILFNKGIINKEALDKYKSRKYYVPLRGWEFNEANPNPESFYDYINNEGDGIYSQTYVKATIKAKGRTSEPGDPLPYIRQIAHSSIMSGVKNNIARTALNLFRMNAKTPEIGSYMYIKEPFKGNAHEAMRTRATAEKHEIVGYDNGDRFTLVLGDPHVAQAIKGENVLLQETAKFLGDSWMGKLTHFMKANFTGKNPNFFLNNFLFIDVPYAAITEGIRKEGESIQFAKQMLTGKPFKTIHRDITNNLNPLTKGEAIAAGLNSKASFKAAIYQYGESRIYDTMYEMWKDAGGPTGWMQLESFEKSAKKINNEVKRIQAKEAGPLKELSKLSTKDKFLYNYPLRKGAELMEYVMAMSEQSSRFAVFVSRKIAGQSTQQAALASKEATVDFDRTGQAGTVFNQLFAFFKPTVSATYGVYKMAKDNKEKFGYALGSFFALGVIQAILAYMSMPEDESGESQYDNLHDYEILNNLIIPRFWDEKAYKEAKYVKIPMPQFFRAIFALGVTSTQVAMGKRDAIDFATTNLGNLVSAMTPFNLSGDDPARVLVPTSIVPAYDIAVNKAFTGKQVYKEQFTKSLEERVPHSQEGKYNTLAPLTEATQWLNEFGGGNQYNRAGSGINTETGLPEKDALKAFMFDWNPAKIQHVAESYGGGRLKFWRQTFSAAYNAVSPDGEVKEWDIPLFYRYLGSAKSENPMTNYYNASRIVDDYKYQLGILKKDDIQEFTNQLKTNSFMNELTYLVKSTKKRIDYFEDLNEKVTDKNKLSAINDSIQSSVVSFNKKLGTLENKYKVNIDKP